MKQRNVERVDREEKMEKEHRSEIRGKYLK
jgi:hypothetical protein